jgi:hypothetical protein
VKWTLLAFTREPSDGPAMASMKTSPVNHSAGPGVVAVAFLVIFIRLLLDL